MQRRTSRYPTRSTVNKAPNYTGERGSSTSPNSSCGSSSSAGSGSLISRQERRSSARSSQSQVRPTSQSPHSSSSASQLRYSQRVQSSNSMHQQQHHPSAHQSVQNSMNNYGHHQQNPYHQHHTRVQPPLNPPPSLHLSGLHTSTPGHHHQQQPHQQQQQQHQQQQLNYSHNSQYQSHRGIQPNSQQQQVLSSAGQHGQAASLMSYSNNAGMHYGQNRVQPQSSHGQVMGHHNVSLLSHVAPTIPVAPQIIMPPNMSGNNLGQHGSQNGSMSSYLHQQHHQQKPQVPAHLSTSTYNYSMPRLNSELIARNAVQFLKLNSYDDVRTLIKPRTIYQSTTPGNSFRVNDVTPFLYNHGPNEEFKVFLRFCKPSSSLTHQLDCLPKSFNLMINQAAFQVKNKYTFAPYDITSRIVCERSSDTIHLRISIDLNGNESNDEFYYGLFLVKKIDHKKLFENFRLKFRIPTDRQTSIDLVKKKLNSGANDEEIAIVENENLIKVSLLCPLTSTRIKMPARSIACDHVHCFEAKTFIEMNEITPRWKCPHCKIFIKIDDLIVDGFFMEILQSSPPNCDEVEIYPEGQYKFILPEASVPFLAQSNPTQNSSESTKRKSEEDVQADSAPSLAKKPNKEIECITLDDSDDESGRSTSSSTINSDSNQNDDDDLEIVFERIVMPPVVSSTNNNSSNHNSNNSNNSNNNIINNYNHSPVPSTSRQSQALIDPLKNIWAESD